MKLGTIPRASSIEQFGELLTRSRLMDADDVQASLRRWRREAPGEAEEVEHFAQWLIGRETVTPYQVGLLFRGHVEHCFLDEYKLLDRIGKGRMAGVYKAVHALGQVVALKVLPPSRAAEPHLLARFRREARMALRLKHPHVVRTFHVADTPHVVYLVMEYLEGETLQEVLQRRGKLPAAEGVRLVYQALLGLQHLHDKRLVHRDLKPSNLMLVPRRGPGAQDHTLRSTVKILDIGLGKDFLDDVNDDPTVSVQLTGEGSLLGTPDYLAPEQARDARSVDIRADIYSLGCMLYHVLAGQTPFPETNVFQLVLRHATDEPRPLRELEPSVPEALEAVLRRMIAKDRTGRYETPARAAEALRPFLPAQEVSPGAQADAQGQPFLEWVETKSKGKRPAKTRRPAAEAASPFELSGLRPRPQFDSSATPAAVVATAVMDLSPEDRARLDDKPETAPAPVAPKRTLLGAGIILGAILTLGIEAIVWLAVQAR